MLTADDLKPGTLIEEIADGAYWAVVVDVQQLVESGPTKGRKGIPVIALEDGKLHWIRKGRVKTVPDAHCNAITEPVAGVIISPYMVRAIQRKRPDYYVVCRSDGVFLTFYGTAWFDLFELM